MISFDVVLVIAGIWVMAGGYHFLLNISTVQIMLQQLQTMSEPDPLAEPYFNRVKKYQITAFFTFAVDVVIITLLYSNMIEHAEVVEYTIPSIIYKLLLATMIIIVTDSNRKHTRAVIYANELKIPAP